MSKELDRLEYICKILKEKGIDIKWLFKEDYNDIKQALQRLESIDNAELSEALEELKKFTDLFDTRYNRFYINVYETIEQALLKSQEQEKVLEILFEKEVSIFQLKSCKNVNEYNDLKFKEENKLTEEEFDLVKRYLKWQD